MILFLYLLVMILKLIIMLLKRKLKLRLKMISRNPSQVHPLNLSRKKERRILITPLTRRINQRRFTFVIIVVQLDTLVPVVTNGQLANRTIVCHLIVELASKLFVHLGELLKAVFFLSNFQGFTPYLPSSKHCPQNKKTPPPSKPPVWKEKDPSR